MEIDNAGSAEGPAAAGQIAVALNLLQTIRAAQTQNGLKHGDYGRYRLYCARRLRSLYKALKFTHGKGRYQKRKLEASMITDARWLLIPLVSAERAWAQAMEIKKDNEDRPLVHRRHHSIRRLTKASAWAADLARFAAGVCDTRSALEAEAYSAWMAGNVLLEKESDWARALGHFTRAKKLFGELAKVGDLDSQGLCGAMVEEIEPSVRFCDYQIKRGGGTAPDAAALLALGGGAEGDGEGGARGLLQSKLAALQAEAQVQQSAATSSFEWRGQSHPVRHERVRVALHTARELAAALEAGAGAMEVDAAGAGEGGEGGGAADGRLAAFDRAINALGEARAAVRALAKANAAGEGGGEGAGDELAGLEKAISGALLERTLERGEEQVARAEARFEAANARAAAGRKGAARQERGAKPEDLLRMHETLMHHCEELGELASSLGGRQGESLSDVASARGAAYAAGRCYYVAHTYLAGDKRPEAAVLFGRCAEGRVAEAREKLEDLPKLEAAARAALPRLAALEDKSRAWRLVAAAEAAAEAAAAGEDARRGIAGMGLDAAAVAGGARYLAEGLDTWESFGGAGGGKGARLYAAPYPLQATPARPIMLDTAAGGIAYPALDHRLRNKAAPEGGAAPSTFARLFGGWGASAGGAK
ncbi:MAG: hypothetical protein J3K34DRAFT_525289 [Monoraphidium minutum]|nr:MAG: hypothetical protein J3K34DRAFT_525289 [Monoraphidium minutum]